MEQQQIEEILWRIKNILTYDDKDDDEKIIEVLNYINQLNQN